MAKLTKSQKIKLIQQIGEHLRKEDYTLIDLTLKQFGMQIADEWTQGKEAYVMEMTKDAADDDLVELAEHFGIEMQGVTQLGEDIKDPDFWEEGKLRTFISHLSSEKTQAGKLKSHFSQLGLAGFVAHDDVHPTLEWQVEIETALATCEVLVALIHPTFIESQWCDQEIGYALGRGIPVLTVKCGADPYGFVSRFQAFNGSGKTEKAIADEIFEATLVHKSLQNRMSEIVVNMFINSGSFESAKTRLAYLEKLKTWDDTFSSRIEKAIDQNSQIGGSWGVPERVRSLIKKWK